MRAVVFRSLAVLAAVLFALPAGWCCMLPSPRAQAAAAECCASCCASCRVPRRTCATPEPPKQPRPTFPCATCCYLATGALPVRTVAHAPKLRPAPTASIAAGVRAPSPQRRAAFALVPHGPSPPLNILHCVWLC
jgi:hypothetical protein